MQNIVLEKINLDILDKTKINNCNLEKDIDDIEVLEKDYAIELKKTHLSSYANLINYPIKFEYEFTELEKNILLEAGEIGILTGQWSKLYDDELYLILNKLNKFWNLNSMYNKKYFVRFNSASPKDGEVKFPIT